MKVIVDDFTSGISDWVYEQAPVERYPYRHRLVYRHCSDKVVHARLLYSIKGFTGDFHQVFDLCTPMLILKYADGLRALADKMEEIANEYPLEGRLV